MAAFAPEREFGGEPRVLGSVLNVVDVGSRITCRPRRERTVRTLDGVRHPAVVVDAGPNGERAMISIHNTYRHPGVTPNPFPIIAAFHCSIVSKISSCDRQTAERFG